ncbi:hypothetical protein PsorP6_014945 [Peronosclerospora sorghi]|uniref:Uncharacterized protein n=1 Tax=Peronosclerospora sorghi TaxID=230839 RepID=A0ACC0VRQ6_9STRA|nr:hypothetical protein PsorP6_014945 [Peronosclerospora sorghi]
MPPAPFEVSDELDAINISSIPTVRRRVLVTGAAGFIGFHTAKALLARGDDVVIIDEINDYYDVKLKQNNLDWLSSTYGSRVTVYIGDICDQQLVRCVLKETKAESIVHLAARAGVRPIYGPRGRPDMASFKFMDRIARGVAIDQYGDGSSSRDYTFIDDIVQGFVLSLDHGRGCEVFNLGRGSPTLLTDFISIIERLVGKKAKINIMPNQPGDVPRTRADISKAEKLLGYKPTTSLEQGLAKTWKWYSEFYNAMAR